MKNYKENIVNVGSDIAQVFLRTNVEDIHFLNMGVDGYYKIYIVENWEENEIPEHYKEVKMLKGGWIQIIGDYEMVTIDRNDAKGFKIYRAGQCGVLINIIKESNYSTL